MTEIVFEVTEDEVDGGYSASAIGYGIHTQGDSTEEVRRNVREAVECYFDEGMERPGIIFCEGDTKLTEFNMECGTQRHARRKAHG